MESKTHVHLCHARPKKWAGVRPLKQNVTMATYKAILEYDGSRYRGWQEQKNARTLMGELRRAAGEVFPGGVEMQGAGRTDAGVHALAQVLHLRVKSPAKTPLEAMRRRLNELLPSDIVVLDLARVSDDFHARHSALSRVYRYQISTRKQAFRKRYVWWVKEGLDLDAMRGASNRLRGRHDFACFRAADPERPNESTIVVVEGAGIEVDGDLILFRIEASHYLWRMVRRIVGVLVHLGLEEIRPVDFETLLAGRSVKKIDIAAWTAPASGLFLERVRYPARFETR